MGLTSIDQPRIEIGELAATLRQERFAGRVRCRWQGQGQRDPDPAAGRVVSMKGPSEGELLEVFRLGELAGDGEVVGACGDRVARVWLGRSRFVKRGS